MTTGAAWNVSNPLKPWAYFDADAVREIPFDWIDWLADIGASYASHVITTHVDLECTNPTSGHVAGVIGAFINKAPAGADLVIGTKYWVTCHIVASDTQEDDQTLWLKIVAR